MSDAYTTEESYEFRYRQAKAQLAVAKRERSEWQKRANDLAKRVSELEVKLARIAGLLKDINQEAAERQKESTS